MAIIPTLDIDKLPLTFGKYKGMSPNEIDDSGYIIWLYENIEPKVVSKDLYMACELDRADGPDEGDRWSIY